MDRSSSATLSTILQILTLLISLAGAIGVLVVNGKMDYLTGQVEALQELLLTHATTPRLH